MSDIRSVEITEPAIYTLSGIIAQPTCSDSLGLIDVTPSGGTGPNVFDWDNDGTGDNDDAEDLEIGDGTYIVNSIDANGCIATGTFTVIAPTSNNSINFFSTFNRLCYTRWFCFSSGWRWHPWAITK